MKLATWAKDNGISRQTATRWYHCGALPVAARQLSTGTILVDERPLGERTGVALYARVSSSDGRSDLDRQLARLTEAATKAGLAPTKTFSEVGSGLNGHRSKLKAVRLVVINDAVVDDDLVRDMVPRRLAPSGRVLISFCARLYGRRSAKRRAAIDVVNRPGEAA